MKEIIKYSFPLVLLFSAGMLAAQGTQLFKFQLEATGQYLTVRQGALHFEDELTGLNALAQSFIISRETDEASSISWAGNPDLLLKRDGTAVQLEATYDADAQWILEYAGYPFTALASPATHHVLSWSAGTFQVIDPPRLEGGDDDPDGISFRFRIKRIGDTF